jgi:hypothetical protein
VRAEPGQQGLLLVLLGYQVDHQLATTDCEPVNAGSPVRPLS